MLTPFEHRPQVQQILISWVRLKVGHLYRWRAVYMKLIFGWKTTYFWPNAGSLGMDEVDGLARKLENNTSSKEKHTSSAAQKTGVPSTELL